MLLTHYFSPGPSRLPTEVLSQVKEELLDTFGIGVSILEISHRSKHYDALNEETLKLARDFFEVPNTHSLFFTPFGAQQHFALLIHHLSVPGDTIAYTDTGNWAHFAVQDAKNSGRNVVLTYDGNPDYKSLGEPQKFEVPPEAKYLHLTVNNTVYGTEYAKIPDHIQIPLVLDMTSAIGARTDIPWQKTGLVYASAQKNFGIAGVSVVIMRNDLLEQSKELVRKNLLGNALSYASIFGAKSALNTPPVFPIFVANRMMNWMKKEGGLREMEARALQKAKLVYDEIDRDEFYRGRCAVRFRSRHNFIFHLREPSLDELFVTEAAKEQILEIKGYRNVGGIRASAYNGVSLASTQALVQFMTSFRKKHG